MDSSGPSSQVLNPDDAGNGGADRPLPPIPDPDVDLYSGDDHQDQRVSLPHRRVNVGSSEAGQVNASQHEIQDAGQSERQGESSRSETHAEGQEALTSSSRASTVDKGGNVSGLRASEELVRPPGQVESHLSTTAPTSNRPPSNQLVRITSSQTESTPEISRGNQHNNTMSYAWDNPWDNDDSRPGTRRVQGFEILPGTVNFRGQGRQSDGRGIVILPIWQADSEVSTCPYCSSIFSKSLSTVDNN